MTPVEREAYLIALDEALLPLRFKRPRSSFEWKRRLDKFNSQSIHLNFGLAGINPSIGVRYEDLAKLLPRDSGSVFQTARMLTSITGAIYSDETLPSKLVTDILNSALPELVRHMDREQVVLALSSSDSIDWPAPSKSHRIRLLPLLLASLGKSNEALQWLSEFESTEAALDQMLPNYRIFSNHFRARFAA